MAELKQVQLEELSPELARLYEQAEALGLRWPQRAIVLALIACGRVKKVECQYEHCVLKSRAFGKHGKHTLADGLQIDHKIPRSEGGSDRPENLRLAHGACNQSRSRKRVSAQGKPITDSRHGFKIGHLARVRHGYENPNLAGRIGTVAHFPQRLDIITLEFPPPARRDPIPVDWLEKM